MGNYISCLLSDGSGGKIVLPDGTVHEFNHPILVAELMLEHPQHFMVEFRSPSSAKLVPLPADHKLDTGKVYLLVPMARGKAATVSADEARRIVSASRSVGRSGSLSAFAKSLSFPGMCMVGVGMKGSKVIAGNGDCKKAGGLEWSTESFDERSEFLSRQYSGKGWKPSLCTIEERGLERKVPHWLFSGEDW